MGEKMAKNGYVEAVNRIDIATGLARQALNVKNMVAFYYWAQRVACMKDHLAGFMARTVVGA